MWGAVTFTASLCYTQNLQDGLIKLVFTAVIVQLLLFGLGMKLHRVHGARALNANLETPASGGASETKHWKWIDDAISWAYFAGCGWVYSLLAYFLIQ